MRVLRMSSAISVYIGSLVALGIGLSTPVWASPIYLYVAGPTSVTLGPGQTTKFNLYLQQTGGPSLLTSEGGLNSAGAKASRATTGLPTNPSSITGFQLASPFVPSGGLALGQTQGSGGFDFAASGSINNTGGGNIFTYSEAASGSVAAGNTGNGITAASNDVYLGTVTVTAGTSAGTTNFTIGERGGTNNFTTTATNFYDLDVTNNTANGGGATYTGVGANTAPFSVTVVTPEPGSLGWLGLSGMLLLKRVSVERASLRRR